MGGKALAFMQKNPEPVITQQKIADQQNQKPAAAAAEKAAAEKAAAEKAAAEKAAAEKK